MSDDFTFQRYTDSDRPSVIELLRSAFSDQYANHLMRIWDWKYDSHPLNLEAEQRRRSYRQELLDRIEGIDANDLLAQWGVSLSELNSRPDGAPYVLLLRHGDRLAAMIGALPQAFMIAGVRHIVAASCEMAVHPDFRGSSLSMRMAVRLSLENGLILGWSNKTSRAVGDRFTKKHANKWRAKTTASWGIMRVVALVKPIDWSYMLHRSTNINLPGNIAAAVAASANRASNPFGKPPAAPGVEVFRLEFFDDRIDDLWRRASREHSVIAVRDHNYLNWRFNSRPDATYVCLAAAEGSRVRGYLVYRMVEQEGARWGYIVDFLSEGDPSLTFALLARHAEDRMINEGAKAIVCFIAKASFRQVLRRAGFYPSVFGTRSYVSGAVIKEDPPLRPFTEVQKWFVTMADGDAEMVF